MTKIFKTVLSILICYLIGAFISNELNPLSWGLVCKVYGTIILIAFFSYLNDL